MKLLFYLNVIVIIFLMYCCNGSRNFFSNNEKIIGNEDIKSDTINGDKLLTANLYRITSVVCFDEYLLVLTPNSNNVFNVLTFDGEIISQFGTKGRSNDELANCQFNGQTENIDGNNCIWICDVSKTRLVLIDIDKSMQNGKFVIIKEIITPPMSAYCFSLKDSVLIAEQLTGKNFDYLSRNILNNTFFQETLYNNDDVDAYSLYKSIWRLDSRENRLVGAMESIRQINFYSLDDQSRWSIVIGEPCTDKKELIDAETGNELTKTFCDLELTDSYIYALYINQDFNDVFEKAKPQEVMIFNLNGDLVRVLHVNEYIVSIEISSNEEYLYGTTLEDEIYRYKL